MLSLEDERHDKQWGCLIAGREQVTGSKNPITHRASSRLFVFSCLAMVKLGMSTKGSLG